MKNDGKQFTFKIPLSMPLHEILRNMGITVENIMENISTNIENPDNYPPSIAEMKTYKESLEGSYDMVQLQEDMLGMVKTTEEKKREFKHILKLNNSESKYFSIEASDIDGGLELTASVYVGNK